MEYFELYLDILYISCYISDILVTFWTVLNEQPDNLIIPDEYPVVGYGGVVVLQGCGPGEEDGAAGDAGDHGSAGRGGRHVLYSQPQRVVRARPVVHQAHVRTRVLHQQ